MSRSTARGVLPTKLRNWRCKVRPATPAMAASSVKRQLWPILERIASSARLTPRGSGDAADETSWLIIIRTQLRRSLVVSPGNSGKVHDRDSRVAKWIAARRLLRTKPGPRPNRQIRASEEELAHGYVHCRQERATRPDRPFRAQDQAARRLVVRRLCRRRHHAADRRRRAVRGPRPHGPARRCSTSPPATAMPRSPRRAAGAR